MKSGFAITSIMLVCMLTACSSRKVQTPHIPKIGEHQTGEASWYGNPYHGRRAANGEIYDMEKLTAAHRTYAFDTWLRVENLSNDKTVIVRITDRGPFVHNRIIDLSRAAAREIDMLGSGVAKVRLEVVAPPKKTSKEAAAPRATDAMSSPSASGGSSSRAADRAPQPIIPPLTDQAYDPSSNPEVDHSILDGNPIEIPIETISGDKSRRFAVQLGAYRDQENALQRAEEIKKFQLSVLIVREDRNSMWKVFAGTFANSQEAKDLSSRLRQEGIESFVVELGR